jgi:curved DNA-binding protein CbpA
MQHDYYKVLGIAPSADTNEIKEAYRKLAFQYHPDRNGLSSASNEKMMDINEAYATLSDPKKRKDHDIPLGYNIIAPKFKTGSKVRVNSHSKTPYRDHTGVVDIEPIKDAFRFWYMVRFDLKGFSTTSRFAEEELSEIVD